MSSLSKIRIIAHPHPIQAWQNMEKIVPDVSERLSWCQETERDLQGESIDRKLKNLGDVTWANRLEDI